MADRLRDGARDATLGRTREGLMRLGSYGLALLLLVAAQPASAERWLRIGGDAQAVHYVDADSIRQDGGLRRARLYSRFAAPVAGRIFASGIDAEYDCAAGRYRTIAYDYFGAGRESLGTERSESIDRWRAPVAGTIDEAIHRFICTRAGGTPVGDPWEDAGRELGAGRD
jgi:hypothetical protein